MRLCPMDTLCLHSVVKSNNNYLILLQLSQENEFSLAVTSKVQGNMET